MSSGLKKRLIAVILVRDGRVVQSVKFNHTNVIHYNPIHAIESFNRWAVDEIIVLNVSKDNSSMNEFVQVINNISKECFVPLCAGGWITDAEYARTLMANGADKIAINTHAFKYPDFITLLAKRFGRQCVVVSIDSKRDETQRECVAINRGSENTDVLSVEWARQSEQYGAGELFINSIDHDGNRKGYNLQLIKAIVNSVSIPVIAMGGVLTWDHLIAGDVQTGCDAVAAANIFHYTEHSTKKAKRVLLEKKLNFRKI